MPASLTPHHDSHSDLTLVASIRESQSSSQVVSTTLKTDERVIARVTDGIYRQPASSLRELISNAYDADATRVVINTDLPRFDRISVEDDGHGMSPESLAHLLLHIGGSAKRSDAGPSLGVTSKTDPTRSPGGRRLIGKIGIGLFSVSQLTHSFQIITKVKGDNFRTVATVVLRQYADDDFPGNEDSAGKFESGKVNIWRERADDLASHGTTIVLTHIRPQARDTLRSRDIWSAIEQSENTADAETAQALEPPKFHIGRVDASGQLLRKSRGQLTHVPWSHSDGPLEAFRKLVDAVWDEVSEGDPNPRLDRIFDYYLRMIWQLSLAVPLPYVDGHLFDLKLDGEAEVFELSNSPKGTAKKVGLSNNAPLRKDLKLQDPVDAVGKFDVYFDSLRLTRPIRFRGIPSTGHAIKHPLVFVGKLRQEFPGIPRELSGGPLAFEAYLLWTPKVAPVEHQGSLIRIHGSSGTLFDPTFMRYQVSEQTRLRQIVCEVFVSEGLDSALNIDRESFNNAHPHSVFITKWLHGALRQLASAQKRIASELREQVRDETKDATVDEIRRVAIESWRQEADDPASVPPPIELSTGPDKPTAKSAAYVFSRHAVVDSSAGRKTSGTKIRQVILDEKLKGIAQVLASFGLLEQLTKRRQEQLLRSIYKILEASDE